MVSYLVCYSNFVPMILFTKTKITYFKIQEDKRRYDWAV